MTPPAAAFQEVTGAILIGGKSRRLGRDKVLIPFEGKPLAVHLHGVLRELFPKTLLIGHPRPELEVLGLPCVEDLLPGKGVLGGIYTALMAVDTPWVFVVAADMPFVTGPLISSILDCRGGAEAVIPCGPRGMEPLCAAYSRSCAGPVERSLGEDTLKVMAALQGLEVATPEIAPDPDAPDPFMNINYPEDLEGMEAKS